MENYIYENYLRQANERLLNPESPQYQKPYYHDKIVTDIFQIPNGVIDLDTDCLMGSEIGTLILPDSLKAIGTYGIDGKYFEKDKRFVLSACEIGIVHLPVNLEILGDNAFSSCKIENMHIYGKCLYCPYARQLRFSHVKNLVFHSQGYDKHVKYSEVYRSIMSNAKVENLIII